VIARGQGEPGDHPTRKSPLQHCAETRLAGDQQQRVAKAAIIDNRS
jgi:hypothetical protein